MGRQTFVLGRLYDIRVGVHVSWLALYAFVTIALARALPMLPGAQAYVVGALCALALFASVVVHEFAHALAARRYGVRTDAITLFLFGGVATLVDEPQGPRADAVIALAGPAMSAVLAVLSFGALALCERIAGGGIGDALALMFAYLAVANGVLAVFNLLPTFPMDGGRVLRAVLWARGGDRTVATGIAARIGAALALVLVAAGVLAAAAAHNALYLWYALLGAFLLRQAWALDRAARRERSIANVEVATAA